MLSTSGYGGTMYSGVSLVLGGFCLGGFPGVSPLAALYAQTAYSGVSFVLGGFHDS